MTTVQIAALILSLTAVLAYINARWVKLPPQIGMLASALALSIAVVALDAAGAIDASGVRKVVAGVNFGQTLVHGMLGLLLFAGALHVPLDGLAAQRWPVAALSLGGTVASTLLVGAVTYVLLLVLGHDIGWLDAMLFGALISPTDPIAVLGVLKRSRVPPELAVQISGESLFNDGVGVVLFTTLLAIGAGREVGADEVAWLFAREAIGGALFGLALGFVIVQMLRATTDASVHVLVTFGLVMGGYVAGEALGVSAPIAAVVAGIAVGNSPTCRASDHLVVFWEIVDDILNAVLFLALGLEATRLHVSPGLAAAAGIAIVLVLASRLISVGATLAVLRPFKRSAASAHAVTILTWGGLRGGLSVALALSLPTGGDRDTILVMTYAIVAFAVLVQGMTLEALLRRLELA